MADPDKKTVADPDDECLTMHYDVIHSYRLREKCRVDGAIHLWPSLKPGQLHFLTFQSCWCAPDVLWDSEQDVFVVRHHLETPMKRKAKRG